MPKIFCAVDTHDLNVALRLAGQMHNAGVGLKLGLEFFNAQGPEGVRTITSAYPDLKIFLDLKFHDIPNTVAGAVRAVTALGPTFINVHAAGGLMMMKAARQAMQEMAAKLSTRPPRLLGVTMLTSLDEWTLAIIGFQAGLKDRVVQLGRLAREAGLDGVVCSAHEIEVLRRACGTDFLLMVPGIRPEGAAADDQRRVMTPQQAVTAGANHLVIGRPITGAVDPESAARAILAEIEQKTG